MKTLTKAISLILVLTPFLSLRAEDPDSTKRARRETDVVRAVRAEKDAVVNISTTTLMKTEDANDIFHFFPEQEVPVHSLGSGFIIHKDGYIITNAHVVQRAQEVTVSFADQTTAKAQAVYPDFKNDLAVIKINPKGKSLHALPLCGDSLMIGETVIAIGNPMGLQHTVTVGVVSAIDRTLSFSNNQKYSNLIQTDAAINPGNSGGPLLNINGELVGINSAIRGDAQNLGFAITVQTLNQILPDLLSSEKINRINLGFRLTSYQSNHIRVMSVNEDSPARAAGLQPGDIITAYDDNKIQNPIDLYVALLEKKPNTKLNLTITREDRNINISIPLKVKPKPNGLTLARKHLGMVLSSLSARQAQQMGLTDQPVLVVERTISNSPAAEAKIRKGDIVFQLDNYRINSLDELGQILESARPGQTATLGVMRIRGNMVYSATVQLKLQ
ncbi:MAG: trypsin-like peptidase domain-containing protein [Phycisphaerae bacterium]